MPNYRIQKNQTKLELEILSTKSQTWLIALAFQFVLFMILIGLSFVIIIFDFSIIALVLGILLILVSIFLAKNAFDNFFWVKSGQEYLVINLATKCFKYKKIGRTAFDKIQADLNDLSDFKWCPDNDEYIDVHPRFGTQGGKICFWIKEKKHRFAISLSKKEAENCILELNRFLKHTKQ